MNWDNFQSLWSKFDTGFVNTDFKSYGCNIEIVKTSLGTIIYLNPQPC